MLVQSYIFISSWRLGFSMYSTKIIKIDMGVVEGGLTFMHRGLGMRYIIKLNVPLS